MRRARYRLPVTERKWTHGNELQRVECGVDFGGLVGYFVSMYVERDDGKPEFVGLTPGEADILADRLRKAAAHARTQEDQRRKG
jgi:hypothetical protein